jgi:hypothetical protein
MDIISQLNAENGQNEDVYMRITHPHIRAYYSLRNAQRPINTTVDSNVVNS